MNNYINQTAAVLLGVCLGLAMGFVLHAWVSSTERYYQLPGTMRFEQIFDPPPTDPCPLGSPC